MAQLKEKIAFRYDHTSGYYTSNLNREDSLLQDFTLIKLLLQNFGFRI